MLIFARTNSFVCVWVSRLWVLNARGIGIYWHFSSISFGRTDGAGATSQNAVSHLFKTFCELTGPLRPLINNECVIVVLPRPRINIDNKLLHALGCLFRCRVCVWVCVVCLYVYWALQTPAYFLSNLLALFSVRRNRRFTLPSMHFMITLEEDEEKKKKIVSVRQCLNISATVHNKRGDDCMVTLDFVYKRANK